LIEIKRPCDGFDRYVADLRFGATEERLLVVAPSQGRLGGGRRDEGGGDNERDRSGSEIFAYAEHETCLLTPGHRWRGGLHPCSL